MGTTTAIEWTDATWNPVGGCSVHTPGCTNCYAQTIAGGPRLRDHPLYAGTTTQTKAGPIFNGRLTALPDDHPSWTWPLRWRGSKTPLLGPGAPSTIFVGDMADLFHKDRPREHIDRVVNAVINSRHIGQFLTKRSDVMRAYFTELKESGRWLFWNHPLFGKPNFDPAIATYDLVFSRIWLGVSAEDQRRADERIPDLLTTPAAIRFVSAEPLLGPIDLSPFIRATRRHERNWSDFQWPAWVPNKVRQEVMDFWRKESARGPSAWLRSSIENGHPSLGTYGQFSLLRAGEPKIEGRFVHACNNIGRVIDAAGNDHCVSAGRWQVPNPYLSSSSAARAGRRLGRWCWVGQRTSCANVPRSTWRASSNSSALARRIERACRTQYPIRRAAIGRNGRRNCAFAKCPTSTQRQKPHDPPAHRQRRGEMSRSKRYSLVDEDQARRIAGIIGEQGAHAMALAELERRRVAGEHLVLCRPR